MLDRIGSLLKRESAARFEDECLQAPVNLSFVNFLLTANDVSQIPSFVLFRCRVVEVSSPTAEHLPHILRGLTLDFAREFEIDPSFIRFDEGETTYLETQFRRHQSVRRLRLDAEGVLATRQARTILQ